MKTILSFMKGGKQRFPEYWDGLAKLDRVSMIFNDDANVRLLHYRRGTLILFIALH